MFFVFRKNQILLFLLLVILIAFSIFISTKAKDENIKISCDFLVSLGYTPEKKPFDEAEFTVPEGFVYENYNTLQKEAGFDLTPYRNLKLKRYSFYLKDGENLIANILFHGNKICGGDISNPSLSGFMLPLTKKQ